MFAATFGFIQDFGQQQKRLDWIQQFTDVKGAQRGPFATGRHGLVPFDPPRRLGIRSKAAAADGEGKEKC